MPAPVVHTADEGLSVVTSYVAQSPSFTLITSSLIAMDPSVHALRSTATAFSRLFGEPAPLLGIVVTDMAGGGPSVAPASPPADLPVVTIDAGGLTGMTDMDPAAALTSDVRLDAARAWMSEYAALWSVALDDHGIAFASPQGGLIPRAATLPDWLHVAVLSLLTEADSADFDDSALSPAATIPAGDLFRYRLSPWEAETFESHLQRPSLTTAIATQDTDLARMQTLSRFVQQSRSVLRYLRASQGDRAIGDLLGASVAGLDMDDILQRMPHPTTPEALEVDWRAWMTTQRAGR
ncbi:MAG TPA: hypothetical protein VGG84_03375 [Gemmatimonadaceae bacterium]